MFSSGEVTAVLPICLSDPMVAHVLLLTSTKVGLGRVAVLATVDIIAFAVYCCHSAQCYPTLVATITIASTGQCV